jgi:hypothetical protein
MVDSVKTWITFPSEGARTTGEVTVRGIATAPDLGTGFTHYRAYYASGHQVAPSNARTIDQLLGSIDWKALRVPLYAQMVRPDPSYVPTSHDRVWPNSNVGVQDMASEGMLANFGPATDTGEYTLLVATETNQGLASWDIKHFYWGKGNMAQVRVDVFDSTQFRHPSGTAGKIDLSNSTTDDDSLVWGIRTESGSYEATAILYQVGPDSLPVDGRILSVRRMFLGTGWQGFRQTGSSDLGLPLDSGNYAWRLQAPDPAGAAEFDTTLAFRVVPVTASAVPPLVATPSGVSRIPGAGVPPTVVVQVTLPTPETIRVDVVDVNGIVAKVLVDSIHTAVGQWSLTVDSLPQGIYSVRLSDLLGGTSTLRNSVSVTIKDEGTLLDTSLALLATPGGETLWTPTATSEFKFRAKAHGTLSYFPERRVDYAIAATGTQTVRNFLTVPWSLDYIKFYNSAEIYSQAQWWLRSYYDNGFGDDGHRWRWSNGEVRRNTLWAPRWNNRWRLQSVADSLQAQALFNGFADTSAWRSRSFLATPYYGDAPWIPLDTGVTSDIMSDDGARVRRNQMERNYLGCPGTGDPVGCKHYPDFPIAGRMDTLAKTLSDLSCSYAATLNAGDDEPADNRCKIAALTNEADIPGDSWKGISSGSASYWFAFRDPTTQIVTNGVQFYQADGLADQDSRPRANTTMNIIVRGFRERWNWPNGPDDDSTQPRIYWGKRNAAFASTGTRYTLSDDDWADDDGQLTFMGLPDVDWNSPHLLMHGRIRQDLNAANLRKYNGPGYADLYNWSNGGNSSDSANCWTPPGMAHDTCPVTFSGPKVGLRGFAFQPNIPALVTKDGRKVPAYKYISNYFDTTQSTGMVSWQKGVHDTGNLDILVFRPKLNTSLAMMGVTWDTLGVPYPLGAWTTPGSWSVETDSSGRLIAFVADSGVSYIGFTGDTSKFLDLRPHKIDTGDIDSADIQLLPRFQPLLDLTTPSASNYGYVYRNSLMWQVSLNSWRMNQDGTFGRLDVDSVYHNARIIDVPGQPLVARVYYRHVPVVLGDWSSDLDTMFHRQQGWMYGAGTFNAATFQGRNVGLPSGFTGMFSPAQFDTALPSTISPFVRKDSRVIFNPSLDTGSLHWDLQVYYPDGATLNGDLDPAGAAPIENFQLQLGAGSGAKSWVPLRGQIPATLASRQGNLIFSQYTVQIRKKDDTSAWVALPVNKFYTADSLGGQLGIHVPRTSIDPWETDTTRQPVLSWWDVSSKVGTYEAMVVATYRRTSDNTLFVVVQKKDIQLGTSVSATAQTILTAPYQRASLAIQPGTDSAGSSVQLEILSPSDVVMPANAPKVAPLGPVVRVQTDGTKVFPTNSPVLRFNLSAREVFQMEGRADFDVILLDSIPAIVTRAASNYRINILGEDGNLSVLTTIPTPNFAVPYRDRDQGYVTLQANVPHFSWAFLQRDDGKGGKRPSFIKVSSIGTGVQITGRSEDSAVAGKNLYLTQPVPTDLVVSWTSDTGSAAKVSALQPQRPVHVGLDGIFTDTIPWTSLPVGPSTLLLHYASSQTADAALVWKASSQLHVWDFTANPGQPIPHCGSQTQTTSFQTDRPGMVTRILEDSSGHILSTSDFAFAIGVNQVTWDACLENRPLQAGVYRLEFCFSDDTTQDRTALVSIGVPAQGLAQFSAHPAQFVPSITDPSHGSRLTALLQGPSSSVVHLNAVPLGGGVQIPLVDLPGPDSVRTFLWTGLRSGPLTGSWIVSAWTGNDTSSRLDTRVDLLSQTPITTIWKSDRDSLQGDVQHSLLSLNVSAPVLATAGLIGTDASASLWPSVPVRVEGQATWEWSALAAALPTAAVVHWVSLDSIQSGMDTLLFQRKPKANPVESLLVVPTSDTLWHGLTPSLIQALHGSLPDHMQIVLSATQPTSLLLVVKDGKSHEVRRDTVVLSAGAAQIKWNGNGHGDSLLSSGQYLLNLSVLDTTVLGPVLVSRTFYLQGLPDLVVVRDVRKQAQAVAQLVRDSAGIDAVVWSDSAAVAYMEARPQGAVAWCRGGIDSFLVTPHPWSPIFRFIRSGGRFASLGGLPGVDSIRLSQGDSIPVALVALLGLASPYSTEDEFKSASTGLFRRNMPTTWADTSLLTDLSLLQGRTDTLHGFGLHDTILQAQPGVWASLAGWDSSWVVRTGSPFGPVVLSKVHDHWTQSFYCRPILWNQNPDSTGALLVAHPYQTLSLGDSVHAQRDFAALLKRFFFSNDISLERTKVKLRAETIRPGDSLVLDVAPAFTGSLTLDSVVVHVTQPSGSDTALIFRKVSPRSVKPIRIAWPWSPSWSLGDQVLSIHADGFVQVDPQSGDTLREPNLSNNSLSLSWRNVDTTHPWVRLDSTQGGRFLRRWSSHSAAGPFAAYGLAGSGRGFGALSWTWKALLPTGQLIGTWMGSSETSSSVAVDQSFSVGEDISADTSIQLRVVVADVFGNSDSTQAWVRIDSSAPKITRWTIQHGSGPQDPTIPGVRSFNRAGFSNDTLLGTATDDGGTVRLTVYRGGTDSPAIMFQEATVSSSSPDSIVLDRVGGNIVWILQACDLANNCTQSSLQTLRGTNVHPPRLTVWRTTRTWLDSLRTDTLRSPDQVRRKTLLLPATPGSMGVVDVSDTINAQYAQKLVPDSTGSWQQTIPAKKGDIFNLVLEVHDQVGASLQVLLDGVPLSTSDANPYLRAGGDSLLASKYWDPVEHHSFQKFVQVPITRSRHVVTVTARDSADSITQGILYLESPSADLQVIDSANDNNGQGADWGEVYMRRNVFKTPQLTDPQTWDYWLIQRRNPLVNGERDNHLYRLLIDEDGDSTTGDTSASVPRGFKGADAALEWTNLTTADDATAAQVTLWRWNRSSSSWVTSASSQEGVDYLKGFGFHMNEVDDPNTVPVGLGDQRLPSGTTARASGGVIELGIQSGASASFHPIRWAIVPDGFAGDTVRGAGGGMLTFQPEDFKPVNVDGDASDWWPNNTPARIEVHSKTDSIGDTLRALIGLKNPTTQTIHGIYLVYWVMTDSAPSVNLSGMPAQWQGLTVSRTQVDSSKHVDTAMHLATWRISISCDSCVLPGGSYFSPIAFLNIKRDRSISDTFDWSHSHDSAAVNGNITVYDRTGLLISGNEPPPRDLRTPVAKITPSGVLWTTVGQPLVLRADSSFDPEGRVLAYSWWHSGDGKTSNALADTFVAKTPGFYTVTLTVRDAAIGNRAATTTDTVFVQDSLGSMGRRPVLVDSLYLFDDQWNSNWNQRWAMADSVRSMDSIVGADGARHQILPYRGSNMLSLRFDSLGYLYLRATCDSSYWRSPTTGFNWCPDEIDLGKYTNLEFKIAMDAGVKQPLRIWLDRTSSGQGNGGSEEDFAYVNHYLADMSDPSHWQTVSIPLSEVYTEPQIRGGWLQLKIMTDDGPNGPLSTHPRVLLDDIRLVRYQTTSGQIVTTRTSGLEVLANTQQTGFVNQLGLTVRLLNGGSVPLQLDSLRMRTFYQTLQGTAFRDTVMGPDDVTIKDISGLPVDSTIDRSQLTMANLTLDSLRPPKSLANEFGQIQWVGNTPGPDSGLRMQSTASAAFWMVVQNWSNGTKWDPALIPMIRFSSGRSLAWSWPDSANFFQFAPHIEVDHLMPDGSWARVWGVAPNEDPGLVSYWSPENLVNPSRAIDGSKQIKAHITVNGTTSPRAHLVAVADASTDPLGHPLQFYWLDSVGHVLQVGSVDSFIVPDTGKFILRLRAFDLLDPTRTGTDSLVIISTGIALDTAKILTGHGGTWIPGSAWGTGTAPTAYWAGTVDLAAKDGSCPVRLHPIGGDSILVLPFSNNALDGVRFDAPTSALDRSRFSHLEFWVATSRDWPSRYLRDLPVRTWLTHQIQPGLGDDNHSSEEDFNLIQVYLGSGHLQRRWQKVSIPLDELFQNALAANSDSTKLFLKFMLDHSASGGIDTSRRADLYLTGLKFVKYGDAPRVTTRRVGVVVFGEANAIGNSYTTRIDLRLLNPSHLRLSSDSLRLRLAYWGPSAVDDTFENNNAGMGTDESVLPAWFSPQDSGWDFSTSIDPQGRKANHVHQLSWNTPAPLIGGKGWEAIWNVVYNDSLFLAGKSRQHFAPDQSSSFSMMTGIVAEYKNQGNWMRLWGYDAWENPDTVNFWGREPLRAPSDTAVPVGSVQSLTGSCSDTSGNGNASSGTSNTNIASGDVSALPSIGRDPLLVTQAVTDAGKTAVQVTQSKPDWNIKHTFVFDTAWAHHTIVDVDVYVDPAEMTGSAWPGTLSLSTFDGFKWLTPTPLGDNGFQQAVGQWVTLRYQYDPSQYTLGESFDLQFLANGHGNNTSTFQFDLGAIKVESASGSSTSSGSSDGSTATTPTIGVSMDSLASLTSCNQCAVVQDGARTAIAVTPAGGGTALAFSVKVDSAFLKARTLSFDIKSEFALQGWEQTWFFVDDSPYRYNWDQYLTGIPATSYAAWTNITIPFNGSLYGMGSTAKMMLVLNANPPSGKRIYVDNLTWAP